MIGHDITTKAVVESLNGGRGEMLCSILSIVFAHIAVRELPVSEVPSPFLTRSAKVVVRLYSRLRPLRVDAHRPGHGSQSLALAQYLPSGQSPVGRVVPVGWAHVPYLVGIAGSVSVSKSGSFPREAVY